MTSSAHNSRSTAESVPADPRHPDDAFLQRELDNDRKGEWILIPKALFALVLVGVLVLIRQLFFV
jgi:hypothetical protein